MVVLARHPAFAVWPAVFIGADMTSPAALYLPLCLQPNTTLATIPGNSSSELINQSKMQFKID